MNAKILVVDDNEVNRSLLRDVLRLNGYEILEATNGKEGVDLARKILPDLVFMDVQMPVMNGMVATKMLKADPRTKNIKIISLTAFAVAVDDREFRSSGFDGYLAKPLDIHAVVDAVRRLVGEGRS